MNIISCFPYSRSAVLILLILLYLYINIYYIIDIINIIINIIISRCGINIRNIECVVVASL